MLAFSAAVPRTQAITCCRWFYPVPMLSPRCAAVKLLAADLGNAEQILISESLDVPASHGVSSQTSVVNC